MRRVSSRTGAVAVLAAAVAGTAALAACTSSGSGPTGRGSRSVDAQAPVSAEPTATLATPTGPPPDSSPLPGTTPTGASASTIAPPALPLRTAVVRAGKVRYLALSNWSAWKAAAAMEFQKANGLAPFTHGQMHYWLLGRDVERDVIPMMRRYGLGLTVWSPLASGFLTGKYTRENLADPDNRYSGFDILPFDKEHGFRVVEQKGRGADARNRRRPRREHCPGRHRLASRQAGGDERPSWRHEASPTRRQSRRGRASLDLGRSG